MKGSSEFTEVESEWGGASKDDDGKESVLGGSIPRIAYNSSSLLNAAAILWNLLV